MKKDRLSQIWDGFSQRASMDLSGTTVSNTPRPVTEHREREMQDIGLEKPIQAAALETPAGSPDPVQSALTAMHTQMAASAKRGRRGRTQTELAALREMPESNVEKTLLADLAFTRSKTVRTDGDYLTYAASRQLNWQRKKKRFFGLF